MSEPAIGAVRAATIRHELARPIEFGAWVITHREFCLVRVDADTGERGFAYALTRDGPVAAIVDRSVGPAYVGRPATDPEARFGEALVTNQSVVRDGMMEPLPEEPGLGTLVDPDWIAAQDVDDPNGLLADL